MTAAELEKLLADAAEIASERREKAAESQLFADGLKRHGGHSHASGWQMAAEYALRTADVLDQTAALARRAIAAERLAEALSMTDAVLAGANMDMKAVWRKTKEALAAYEAAK